MRAGGFNWAPAVWVSAIIAYHNHFKIWIFKARQGSEGSYYNFGWFIAAWHMYGDERSMRQRRETSVVKPALWFAPSNVSNLDEVRNEKRI